MARERFLYVGDPDNIYSEENNLFDNDNGGTGVLGDYGSEYKGLMVNGRFVSQADYDEIDWNESYIPTACFIEYNKEVISNNDNFSTPIDFDFYNKIREAFYSVDNCKIVMLNVHV